ncbi:RNA-directed DNA polymerase, eukaryota [Tanacetum coccineum]
MVMGDFNKVRRMEERWGSVFNVQGASAFNNFITNSGLVDVQLEGYSFTWAHPSATKMSKLDRFLVTDGLLSFFPHISAVCLDMHLSDHRPILLREASDLETPISRDEIRNVVWGCGENKSPRTNGFTFEFFRKFWAVVGPDLCTAVEWFFDHVNGSPTSEFQFHCGLKQGDPLALYLFILIMESLHFYFSRVIDAGIFTRVRIDSSLMISHLFYADDAVFIGEWSQDNLKAAVSLGCSVMKTPFKYLGVMVGGNISLVKAWDDTVGKLKTRLSKWKLKTLSIGGRLTLLKSVIGSTPIYNMSLYKVPKTVLNSMEELSASHSSTWSSIIKEINVLKDQGVDLISHCKI